MAGRQQGGHGGVNGPPAPYTYCVLRVDVANRLEKSLQRGRELLALHENKLTQDDTMPESGYMLDSKRQELEVSLGAGDQGSSLWAQDICLHH